MARAGLDVQQIIKAAAELVDAQGAENLTLASLAQKLGVRSPSLYNHVNGLPGLRKQLVLYAYRQLREVLTRATAEKSGDEAVRALAYAYRSFVLEHPGVYEAASRYAHLADEEVSVAAAEIVEAVLQVLKPYGLQGDQAVHIVRGFRSMVHGFASIELQGGFGMPLDLDESFRILIDTFLAGIKEHSAP